MPRRTKRSHWAATAAAVAALLLAAACGGEAAPEQEAVDEVTPSRAAVVSLETSTLIAVVDGEAHRLEDVMSSPGQRVLWSPDGSLMTVNDGRSFWEWHGPDSEGPVMHECGTSCQGVHVEEDPGELHAFAEDEIHKPRADTSVPTEFDAGFGELWGSVDGRLLVGEPSPADRAAGEHDLWLADPATGEAAVAADLAHGDGLWIDHAALSADGSRLALEYGDYTEDGCPTTGGMTLLDTADLGPASAVPPAPRGERGGTVTWDLFFNGGTVYAVFAELHGDSSACAVTSPMGLWRLNGDLWEQVNAGQFYTARPLEGLDGPGSESALIVDSEFECRVVDLPGGTVRSDLGRCDIGFWSTPTYSEVDLSGVGGM